MKPELISALARLAWPILAAVILVALLPTLRQVAASRAYTVKFGNLELSVQEGSDQLRKQIEDLQGQMRGLGVQGQAPPAHAASSGVEAQSSPRRNRSILWVDDHPQNNAYEIAKLQNEGWEIVTVESTQAAIAFLDRRTEPPTLIISDMARREGLLPQRTAGLDLIREVRGRDDEVPIFVYASGDAAARYGTEVRQLRGNGITSSPLDLFRWIDAAAS